MNIASAESTLQNVRYGYDSFEELLHRLDDASLQENYHLSLFVGQSEKQKEHAFRQIEKRTDKKIQKVDANELISESESKTRQRLNQLFKNFAPAETILYLTHGANLCGAYTGYTLSRVKYATPQERYFLKNVQQNTGLIIIDFEDIEDADRTLCRAAHSIVTFETSDSPMKQLIQNLKKIKVQGYQFNTKRPSHKGETAGNF